MVFENVTLFEVHLDDAQFGPGAGRASDDARDEAVDAVRRDADERATGSEPTDEEGSGRSRIAKLAVASVVVSVVATLAARRLTGRDDEPAFDAGDADEVEPAPYTPETTDEGEPAASSAAARDE
ncbi:hypothetical protein [Halosimplex sp. TS25]|uniref:hypothetical protein n=1 Tax=Halosimplex rarum TaxID=3396619 RepID=UPI0039EAFC5A